MSSKFSSTVKFASLPIHVNSLKSLNEVFGYEAASAAQSKYLPQLLDKSQPDAFIKASTGSGKTLGFLLPVIEMLVGDQNASSAKKSVVAKGASVNTTTPAIANAAATNKRTSAIKKASVEAATVSKKPATSTSTKATKASATVATLAKKASTKKIVESATTITDVVAKKTPAKKKVVANVDVVAKKTPAEKKSAAAKKKSPAKGGDVAANKSVQAIILSPSREIALQTMTEAKKLTKFHPSITTACVIGGTSESKDKKLVSATPPSILIATPGRLEKLMQALPERFAGVRVVVLDEADRLLDQGFLRTLRKLLTALPKAKRMILVTATVPEEVKGIAKDFMRADYKYIDTVESNAQDQQQITQYFSEVDPRTTHAALHAELSARAKGDYKILVFLPSKRLVDFFAALFKAVYKMDVLKLHGDMPQSARTRSADAFRAKVKQIMFATDAAGRGVDFPGVTCVVQVGVVDTVVYKQRIGRTGRGGRTGESVIILGTDERKVLEALQKVNKISPVAKGNSSANNSAKKSPALKLTDALQKQAKYAYLSTLGAYKSEVALLKWNSKQLFDAITERFIAMGMAPVDTKDAKFKKLLKKLGISL